MNTLDQQHQNWMEVTGKSVSRRHQADGYKGPVKAKDKGNPKGRGVVADET